MDKIFKTKEKNSENKSHLSFSGSPFLSKTLSGFYNNDKIQRFVKNNVQNSKNITRDVMIAGDTFLAAFSAFNIKRNKKIERKRKNNLIYNNLLSTVFSISAGFLLDKTAQKKSAKYIDKFKEINASNPKLEKYIQGINIIRPTIIFALVYYGLLPIASNFLAQKISNKFDNKKPEYKFENFQEFKQQIFKKKTSR